MYKNFVLTMLLFGAFSSLQASDCWYFPEECCAFISVGGGGGWSTKADLQVDTRNWDFSPEGYDDEIGNSEFYTLGVGYHCICPLSIVFDVTYRPNFEYKRFQTSAASATQGFLGTKTRFFKLSSLAFMANVFLNKNADFLSYRVCNFCLAPFVGAGIGAAYNCVSDFHSVIPPQTGLTTVHSIMHDRKTTGFAAQVMAGLVARLSRCVSVELAYRRYYGGHFATNNYVIDIPTGPGMTDPIAVPPWKGWLNTNEIYLNFNFAL